MIIPDFSTLSPKQLAAVHALATGSTVTAAAKAAGVHRDTVHDWTRHDNRFQAAINEGRHLHAQEIAERLRDLTDSALDTLAAILATKDASPATRLRAALEVVRTTGEPRLFRTIQSRDYHHAIDAAAADSQPAAQAAAA
ncbi:MAG: hypothetical protein U0Q16_27895 [Bryobacteraceae bacterium]